MAKVDINQQNSVPRIDERGTLVYSEVSDTLFIRTLRQGVKAIGGSETDPIFTAWLATPPNVSTFVNDAGYLTSSALTGYVPTTRNLTINGTTYDLSADRTWTVTAGLTQSQVLGMKEFI